MDKLGVHTILRCPGITDTRKDKGKTMTNRWIRLACVGMFALCLAFAALPAKALTVSAGNPAPEFELKDLDGKVVKLADYRGKVVMMAFWASWCPRCMEELAFLQGLYTGKKDQLTILAINQDTKNLSQAHVDSLRSEIKQMGLEFPVLLDTEFEVWQKYGINALPTSVVVDKEGKIVYAEPNYYWASQKKIRNVLAGLGIGTPEAED